MKIESRRLRRMLAYPASPFILLLAGIYSFMWGLWVASPFWNTFPSSPIYEILSWTGSELVWGGVQMAVGLALAFAAFDSLRWMKWATFSGFISWFLIALSFAISDWQNAGMWVCGFIAALMAYLFLNTAKREKKQ